MTTTAECFVTRALAELLRFHRQSLMAVFRQDFRQKIFVHFLTLLINSNLSENSHLQVETVRVTKHDEHAKAIGLITIKSIIDKLHYNIAKVLDPNTGKSYDMMAARNKGILDLRTNEYVDSKTKERISLDKAIETELVTVNFDSDNNEPEIVKKTYAINYVVDQKKKEKVPFYEAVQMGLINAETGEYVNNKTMEKVYVGDAIRKGFLKGREVQDTFGLDIDAENKDVTRRISKIRKNVVRSIAVVAAFRRAIQQNMQK